MQIEHVALWSTRPETLRDFYVRYFGGTGHTEYRNPAKRFRSFFVSFGDGTRLEIMQREDIAERHPDPQLGWCHLAFGCTGREEVVALTERLRRDGHPTTGEPRTTGDGYFESVVADPDGNTIEIVCKQ